MEKEEHPYMNTSKNQFLQYLVRECRMDAFRASALSSLLDRLPVRNIPTLEEYESVFDIKDPSVCVTLGLSLDAGVVVFWKQDEEFAKDGARAIRLYFLYLLHLKELEKTERRKKSYLLSRFRRTRSCHRKGVKR